ncbi:uncharacterized protein LOC144351908 [Saccoglossus kowalevskii]
MEGKRSRGRPRKPQILNLSSQSPSRQEWREENSLSPSDPKISEISAVPRENNNTDIDFKKKRGPGRPRKCPTSTTIAKSPSQLETVQSSALDGPGSLEEKHGPGRSCKSQTDNDSPDIGITSSMADLMISSQSSQDEDCVSKCRDEVGGDSDVYCGRRGTSRKIGRPRRGRGGKGGQSPSASYQEYCEHDAKVKEENNSWIDSNRGRRRGPGRPKKSPVFTTATETPLDLETGQPSSLVHAESMEGKYGRGHPCKSQTDNDSPDIGITSSMADLMISSQSSQDEDCVSKCRDEVGGDSDVYCGRRGTSRKIGRPRRGRGGKGGQSPSASYQEYCEHDAKVKEEDALQDDCTKAIPQIERRSSSRRGRPPSALSLQFPLSYKLYSIFEEQIRIQKKKSAESTKLVGQIESMILKYAKKKPQFENMKTFHSGSHFENLKASSTNVSSPDELDIMFELAATGTCEKINDPLDCQCFMRLQLDQSDALFCYCKDGYLSPKLLLKAFKGVVSTAIKHMHYPDINVNIFVPDDSDGSPSVQLQITEKPTDKFLLDVDLVIAIAIDCKQWPAGYDSWILYPWFSQDEELELKKCPFHLVAKSPPPGKLIYLHDPRRATMWRISYSLLEKKILYTTDSKGRQHTYEGEDDLSGTTCRKQCLRLLKLLRMNLLKKINKRYHDSVPSYFLKTAFLHECLRMPNSEDWTKEHLHERIVQLLEYIVNKIRRGELRHFFIRSHNLMSSLHSTTRHELVKHYVPVLKDLTDGSLHKIFNLE